MPEASNVFFNILVMVFIFLRKVGKEAKVGAKGGVKVSHALFAPDIVLLCECFLV